MTFGMEICMNILVCIKQVPGSNNIEVDPVTGVLKRNGVKSKINPYDLYGIETALSLAERFGAEVAEYLGIPNVSNVLSVDYLKDGIGLRLLWWMECGRRPCPGYLR